jgi:hypothetical protein
MAALPVMQMDPQTQQPAVDPQTGQPAQAEWLGLLRNQVARDVLIDVETDSTVQGDEDAEKQRRMELLSALTESMQPLLALNQLDPAVAAAVTPLWGDTVSFVLRGFRAGRELEETVEQTMQQLVQLTQGKAQAAQQAQGQPPPPDPAMQLEQAKTQEKMKQTQIDEQSHAKKLQLQDQADERKAQRADALAQKQYERDTTKIELETKHHIARKATELQAEQQRKGLELDHAGKQKEIDFSYKTKEQDSATKKQSEASAPAFDSLHKRLDQIGQALISLARPKRIVKDPKTGEKRAEYVN